MPTIVKVMGAIAPATEIPDKSVALNSLLGNGA